MRNKTFNDLITEAQFVKVLESGLWDKPTVSLIDARQSLEDLRNVYSGISQSTLVSLSLGAGRKFQLRKKGKGTTIHDYWLEHGSLLLMQPGCQLEYIHQLPKSSVSLPRINLTFRPYYKVS
jgi:hypothetical protein